MTKEVFFNRGRQGLNSGTGKLVFLFSVKADGTRVEPILDVLRRCRKGASRGAPDLAKLGDRIRKLQKRGSRRSEDRGSIVGKRGGKAKCAIEGLRGAWSMVVGS